MILCPKCFTANEDNAKFCCKCGDPLDQQVEEEVVEETTILEPQIDFGSNSGRVSSEITATPQMSGSLSGASANNAPSTGGSVPDAGAAKGNGNQAATSKTGVIALAIAAISVILAVACLVLLLTTPKASEEANKPEESKSSAATEKVETVAQPDRSKNVKSNALSVNLKDMNAASNLPGCVKTDDASTVKNLPSAIKEGKFYALWDCDVLTMSGDGKAHLLVTMREMYPVPGRVWVNWYNWENWTGWKAFTPS